MGGGNSSRTAAQRPSVYEQLWCLGEGGGEGSLYWTILTYTHSTLGPQNATEHHTSLELDTNVKPRIPNPPLPSKPTPFQHTPSHASPALVQCLCCCKTERAACTLLALPANLIYT